jgi:L-lactate dehydrogenase (cytochrome)/(S)-mandelate dehydrogenase
MGPINFDPSALSGGGSRSMQGAANAVEAQLRFMGMDLNWDDIAWIRDQWKGPFYVKGLLDPEDAKYAVDVIGAEGVIVSNHGGRQLDDVTATIDALPHIVSALGGRGEVYLDGGIRRGTDIIKALCLGARGVFVGRAVLYGAAVSGQAGVAGVLKILRDEVHRGMVLMGCNSVADLDRSWLVHPDGSPLAETVA